MTAVYRGRVMHQRLRPLRHRLSYRVFSLLLDIDELPALDARLRWFSVGRFNLFSFRPSDYGDGSARDGAGLRAQIEARLAQAGLPGGGAIRLLTMPRLFGYAFNPLSVWFCEAPGEPSGRLQAIVYEVNNTFGERHSYVIPVDAAQAGTDVIEQRCDKQLFVSPFLGMALEYRFRIAPPGERVSIGIGVHDEAGDAVLHARLEGERAPMTDARLLGLLVTHPLLTLKVVAGIHWEALRLWLKGARLHARPTAPSAVPATRSDVPAPLRRLLSRVRCGRLSLTLPDGRHVQVEGTLTGPHAELRLHRWRPAWRMLLQGDLGLAFSYRDGDWESPDLVALLSFGIANESALGGVTDARGPARWLSQALHRANANTRRGSRHNIAAHYDLGNRFYERWLDDTMLYSSAIDEISEVDELATVGGSGNAGEGREVTLSSAPRSTLSLEAAQARRLDRIIELLDLRAGQRVLEIGCGWGTLAATLAKRCGVEVVGLTLSTEQLAFARERAAQWGVADRVDLRLQDYRDVTGRFDRIVSIEMIEAVGEAYWPTYFETLRDRLAPDGLAVLQAITIDEQHFERYRANPDFIQRCIFPGGMLPTPERMAAQARRAGLTWRTEARFGRGYAATLAAWRQRFLAEWPAIEAQGFDLPFKRLWTYYLSYCEAGFRDGRVDVGLYRLTRAA